MRALVVVLSLLVCVYGQGTNDEGEYRARVTNPPKLHFVDLDDGLSGKYKFGFDTGKTEVGQVFRQEKRLADGTVVGKYGYVDEYGKQRIVSYTAGINGFQATGDIEADKNGPLTPTKASKRRPVAPAVHRRPTPRPVQARPPPQPYRPPQRQQIYRPPPRQQPTYRPPPPQRQYFRPPPPHQPYNRPPPPQQQYYRPPSQQQVYRPPPTQPRYVPRPTPRPTPRPAPTEPTEEPDYGPPVIPVHLLSYGFGSAYDGQDIDF